MNNKLSSKSFVVSGPSFQPGIRPAWCRVKYPFGSASNPYLDNYFLTVDTEIPDTHCLNWPRRLRDNKFNNTRSMKHELPMKDIRLYQSTCMNCVYYVSKFNYSPKAVIHRANHLLDVLQYSTDIRTVSY